MSDLTDLAASLRAALPPGIGLGVVDPRATYPPLFPGETEATRKMVGARFREFAAGRAAARAAMADLGLPPVAIPMGRDRAPVWQLELRGSISHCAQAAVALVARSTDVGSLGIDIEDDAPLDPALWSTILTPDELNDVMRLPGATGGADAKRIFSAKEAIYKAQYPLTKRMLDFGDVTLSLRPHDFTARFSVSGRVANWSGRCVRARGLILNFVCPTGPESSDAHTSQA